MRFSLMSLLVLTGVVALFCCLFFVLPPVAAQSAMIILGLLLPSAMIAGIVYGRGYGRAFAIGGIVSCSWILLFLMYMLPMMVAEKSFESLVEIPIDETGGMKRAFAVQLFLTVCTGLTAMGVRWLCLRSNYRLAKGDKPHRDLQTVLIDPRDKAELYAILQGRMSERAAVSASDKIAPPRHLAD